MKEQHIRGKPISDDASKVCILFDPKDGHVVHVHGSTVIDAKNDISESESEARARKFAKHFGKSVDGLKAIHVPIAAVRQYGKLRVNERGDGLIPSPKAPIRNRSA